MYTHIYIYVNIVNNNKNKLFYNYYNHKIIYLIMYIKSHCCIISKVTKKNIIFGLLLLIENYSINQKYMNLISLFIQITMSFLRFSKSLYFYNIFYKSDTF